EFLKQLLDAEPGEHVLDADSAFPDLNDPGLVGARDANIEKRLAIKRARLQRLSNATGPLKQGKKLRGLLSRIPEMKTIGPGVDVGEAVVVRDPELVYHWGFGVSPGARDHALQALADGVGIQPC